MTSTAAQISGLELLAPVQRVTAQDRVYHQLRNALIRGNFDAGAPFLVSDLAARMSVSAMPVREALARLVSERALEAMANRRVRVPLLDRQRARGIFNARVLIEGALARAALPHLTARDIAALDRAIEVYETAADNEDVVQANQTFHFRIYDRAPEQVLRPFVESLWMQAWPYIRAAARLHPALFDGSCADHHRGMVTAIRDRDPDALVGELTHDITRVSLLLEAAGDAFWESQEKDGHD